MLEREGRFVCLFFCFANIFKYEICVWKLSVIL